MFTIFSLTLSIKKQSTQAGIPIVDGPSHVTIFVALSLMDLGFIATTCNYISLM
jgi:hypothetical protein